MTMMVLDGYLLKKYFLALQNACVQFSDVTTVVISQFVIWNKENIFFHISNLKCSNLTLFTLVLAILETTTVRLQCSICWLQIKFILYVHFNRSENYQFINKLIWGKVSTTTTKYDSHGINWKKKFVRIKFISAVLPDLFTERRKSVSFSIAIGNVILMHECFAKQFRMGKGKVFYGRSLPMENLLPQNVGSIINYLQ